MRNAVAVADSGRAGGLRYLGEVDTTDAAIRKLIAKLAVKYTMLTLCYEAAPTGYGVHRLITSLGHACIVAAPSLSPVKAGDRVKTNRRNAKGLARRFWAPIETGRSSEMAATEACVSPAVGARWFREAGGMRPSTLAPSSHQAIGRYRSFAEREELAILRAQGKRCTVPTCSGSMKSQKLSPHGTRSI